MTTNKPDQGECTTIIYVNKESIHIKENVLTGKQIMEYANLDTTEHDLFLVQGQNSERILDNQSCDIKNEMQLHAILKSVPYG